MSGKVEKAVMPGPYLEDASAPIVYADTCMGGGPMGGDNITLTFAAKYLDHRTNPPENNMKTVLRLVMPRQNAGSLADFIKQLVASVESGATITAPADVALN